MDAPTFDELLERYQSGNLTVEETAALEALLRADPACRRLLVERSLLEANLRELHSGMVERKDVALKARPPTRRAAWRRYAPSRPSVAIPLAAAAAIFASIALFFAMSSPRPDRRMAP